MAFNISVKYLHPWDAQETENITSPCPSICSMCLLRGGYVHCSFVDMKWRCVHRREKRLDENRRFQRVEQSLLIILLLLFLPFFILSFVILLCGTRFRVKMILIPTHFVVFTFDVFLQFRVIDIIVRDPLKRPCDPTGWKPPTRGNVKCAVIQTRLLAHPTARPPARPPVCPPVCPPACPPARPPAHPYTHPLTRSTRCARWTLPTSLLTSPRQRRTSAEVELDEEERLYFQSNQIHRAVILLCLQQLII